MSEILRPVIEECFVQMSQDPHQAFTKPQLQAIRETMDLIDQGRLRVASPLSGNWHTHAWVKQAILLYFKITPAAQIQNGPVEWRDKIQVKGFREASGVRAAPLSFVRYGAHVEKNTVLMPCFINIGAYVDTGTMVDTWATVGSCAQIGKNVHLSGGVGIGGVLEPAQAAPVIIEDECFLGSRSIVVEGVHVKRGAVLGAGVVLTKSTPIVDASSEGAPITKGVIGENAVVIPGSLPKKFPGGTFNVPCALVIGKRSASTDSKTSLNQVLRDLEVPV
jgi:2,3,4,5-tetrahydropyridine-2-carboxylate N-succinyltransferase